MSLGPFSQSIRKYSVSDEGVERPRSAEQVPRSRHFSSRSSRFSGKPLLAFIELSRESAASNSKSDRLREASGFFLIIANLGGFNDSVTHLQKSPNEPWPVVRVHKGDRVNIMVCNTDDYSPHGFAVEHYLDAGVALMPHESFRRLLHSRSDGELHHVL